MIHITKGLVPFWDDYMLDTRFTTATLSVNQPIKKDIVMVHDQPWDGNANDFYTIIRDDGFYRMYYETWSFFDPTYTEGINVCYAESKDGLHWERPNLGMCAFRGDTNNNIIMTNIPDNITVMKDENPACPPEHRYKAIMAMGDVTDYAYADPNRPKNGLVCMVSADGIHFEKYNVISQGYAYDSQNSVHWNPHAGKYYCYFRDFHQKPERPGTTLHETEVRNILVSESEDFIHWSEPESLRYGGSEDYPLYTNCVMAYPYDTRYYIGFPTRYVERKAWTPNYDRLCGADKRKKRMEMEGRLGLAVTDCVFMSSRDNKNWYRFDEACVTPGPEEPNNWVYGDCYPAIGGLIETPSSFAGEPNELSIYIFNHHWMPEKVELVRYTYRRDGFASVKAGYAPKVLSTPTFTFEGEELAMNFRTSARGNITVEVQDIHGNPIEGYTSCEIFGDALDRIVDFSRPFADLQGREIRLVITMQDAEIYALRFQ